MTETTALTAQKPEAKVESPVSRMQEPELSQFTSSPIDRIMFLQRTIGNQAVNRLLKLHVIQAKLKVSEPGDKYEQEADRVAEQVVSSTPQHKCTGKCSEDEGKKLIQRKAEGASDTTNTHVADSFVSNLGPGKPLDSATRAFFEPRFGHDFSGVRVHTDAKAAEMARAVNARAFTVGRDVVFGEREYSPETSEGKILLAHELTHSIQQKPRSHSDSFFGTIYHSSITRISGNALQRNQNRSRTSKATAKSTAPDTVMMYQYTVEGKTFRLNEAEFYLEKARVNKKLELDFKLLEEEVSFNKLQHQEFLDKIHGWAGIISDILGDTVPPHIGIWSWPMSPIKNGRGALQSGNLVSAGRQLKLAKDSFHEAQREWNNYIDKTSNGAQKAVTTLEYTRDISFSIAIGTAAVVAAPVVAGALLSGGATTTGAVLGSGAIVTAGGGITGGVLRGVSSASGQALAGGSISGAEVLKEMKEGAKRGTVDAASSVVGFGAGKALGLGAKGVSLGGKIIRGGLAGGASGATGGAIGSTLEGKSASGILEDAGKGAFTGMTGGAIGSAASHISAGRSTVTKYAIETLGEAGSGAASAAVTGGSLEDIKKEVITSVVSGRATSAATHPDMKVTKGTKSAFELDLGSQPERPVKHNELEPQVDSTKGSGLELDLGFQPERPVKHNELEPQVDLTKGSGLELDPDTKPGSPPSIAVKPTAPALSLNKGQTPLSPLPNEPSPYVRGGPLTKGERQRAERLLNRSLGQAHEGPVKVTRWPSKSLKETTKVVKTDPSGKPSVVEFKGWGEKGELITVRSVKGQKLGRITSMEIENINLLSREARDNELARAMKAAGMGDWKSDLGHIQPLELMGAEMPYNREPQPKKWNQAVKGRINRRTAEIRLRKFLDAHPNDYLRLEISRKLNARNVLQSERFCVRDKSGTAVFDVEVTTRGKLIDHVAP